MIHRPALNKLSYGMYVLGSSWNGKSNAMIANALMQVTSKNPTIAVSVSKENVSSEYINNSKLFSVSILEKDAPLEFIYDLGFRSAKDNEKIAGLKVKEVDGVPVFLDYAVAYITAKLVEAVNVGTHVIFIGEVISSEEVASSEVMTYSHYKALKGATPRTAPTFNVEKMKGTKNF